MKIRPFEEKDSTQILSLFDEFGEFFLNQDPLQLVIKAPAYSETLLKEMRESISQNGIVYVAEDSDKITGFIAGNILEITPESSVESIPMSKGRVLELFVTSSYRSKGVGRLLMEKLEDFFKTNNCHTINVEVFGPNEKAQQFYASLGYSIRNIDMMKVLQRPTSH